jgi:hypothetical protein
MDKEVEPTKVEQIAKPVKPVKKTRRKIILLGLLIAVLLIATAGGSYWWQDKSAKATAKQQAANIASLQQTTVSLSKQLTAEKAKDTKAASTQAEPACACTLKAPSATTISNIEASITSGNTAALEGYMAASVNVVYVGVMGSGAQTPTQAVTSITSFISSDTSSWDYNFSLSASTLSSYVNSANYGKYFPCNAVVGKATNNQVISFSFDSNAKINTVLLAANESELK